MKEIESYLRFLNNFYCSAEKGEHLLFVEGYTDKEFYKKIFDKDESLAIDDKNIYFNFAVGNRADEYNELWIKRFGDAYRKKAEGIVQDTKGKFKNYDFVIAVTHESNLPPKENCKINCFGFVDKDFGNKKDIDDKELVFYDSSKDVIRNLAQTSNHDLEASLFYQYAPKLFGETSEENIEKLKNILLFTTKQGIMEQLSISNKEKNESCFDFYELSNANFDIYLSEKKEIENEKDKNKKEKIKKSCGEITKFNFKEYFNWYKEELETSSNNDSVQKEFFKSIKLPEIERYEEKCFGKFYEINNKINNDVVREWLESKNCDSILNDVFNFTNGHRLLIAVGKIFWGFLGLNDSKEKTLREKLYSLAVEEEKIGNIKILNSSPIKEYYKYRKDILNRL